ncbi:MAG: condensation domain-containing protein [Chloroflexota bacterium]
MQAVTAVTIGSIAGSHLTDLQHLYWIGHQLRPFATHFNNAFSFTFHTPLCADWFAQAWQTAVSEHDALRTIFIEVDGAARQQILPSPPASLAVVDLSEEAETVAAARQWQQQQVQRPFTLNQCLYDTALLKITDTHFVWFLNLHHLITDAASFFLIADTVLRHYDNLRRGLPPLPAEKPTFARYAASLQRQQHSGRAAAAQAFWQAKLLQRPEPLQFYGRSAPKQSHAVTRWVHNLGTVQTARLIALAETADLGPSTAEFRQFCLTASLFFALMRQLTSSTQLGFVTTIHNRATQVNRQTVGVLMALCPVLIAVDPDERFSTLMQKVAAEMKQLLLHYRHGASRATADLGLEAMFSFVQRPSLTFDGQPIHHQIIHPGTGSERLGLHIHHLAADSSYDLYLDLHQDVFSEAQQLHARQSLLALITALLANPDTPIATAALPWPSADTRPAPIAARPTYEPPRTPIEGVLQQIWQEVLGRSPIGIQDDFFALGGESWQALRFLARCEAETGIALPLSALIGGSTIAGLASQIEQPVPASNVIQLRAGLPTVIPFFFVPGAAGNTLAVHRLAQKMSPDQPIYTFQMPTLDPENLPPAEMPLLARHYLEAIRTVQPHGPYYLGGYSAGGIFAYELAQQLTAHGEAVRLVAIIDMPAPNPAWKVWWRVSRLLAVGLHLTAARHERLYLLGRDAWNRATFFRVQGFKQGLRRVGQRLWHIWRLPPAQKWQRLRQKVRPALPALTPGAEFIARDMDPSGLYDPRARTLFGLYDRAIRQYLPAPYDGCVTLVRCPLGYGRKELRSPYTHYGWGKLAAQVVVHEVAAPGHLALMQETAVTEVGNIIQQALTSAMAE